jgi:hypothetical protein
MYWPGTTAELIISRIRAAPFSSASSGLRRSSTTVPVRAKGRGRTLELVEQAEDFVPRCSLGQLFTFLDLDSERGGERFDRLHTSEIRARADAIDTNGEERRDEPVRLLSSPLVERPQAVVAAPALPPARARVAHEHDSAQTVLSKEARTPRSRSCESRFAASGSRSQRTSSISSWAENDPLSGRIAQ